MRHDRWRDATVFVTGASRGIGEAVARVQLTARGSRVGLLARTDNDLQALASELGGRTAWASVDVAERADVHDAVASLVEDLGPPDILVNNAGVGSYASFIEEDDETFERLMRINYFGVVYATRAVLPWMIDQGSGHLVNIGSIAGRLGAPFESAYSASKFAVTGLSESLSAELYRLGIHVSLVEPGPVDTSFTDARGVPFQQDIPRPVAATQIADAVLHAVDRRRFEQIIPRWLTGPTVVRAAAPGAYRNGVVRTFTKQSRALARRVRGNEIA